LSHPEEKQAHLSASSDVTLRGIPPYDYDIVWLRHIQTLPFVITKFLTEHCMAMVC